ncbi:MAG: thioester reductase domain-containing protein [Pseudomonadota bacterium]|nr:thioester reductase domain-containing protein [Pseudomonadota bacterium]
MNHLSARLAALPSGPLYTFRDLAGVETALDVDALRGAARALAGQLHDERGAPVLVVAGPGAEHPVGLFAAWEAGAFAVPLYPPMDEAGVATIAAVAKDCGARVLLASRGVAAPLLAGLEARGLSLRWVELTVSGDGGAPASTSEGPGGDGATPAILLYTSGSTGAPKGAILRHESLLQNMQALATACGRSSRDVVCTWLPHAHVAGLYTRLLPVVLGARGTYLPPAAFLQRPLAWVEALSEVRATITAAPDFAYALVASMIGPEQAAALDLSPIDLLVSGGEVVRTATVDRFLRAFAPSGLRPASLHPYYGLTETLCTSIPQGKVPLRRRVDRASLARGRFVLARDGATDAHELLSNGPPLPGTEVVVVDPERGAALPPGRVGELWTRGPGVIRAYTGDPARSAASCAATLADGSGPWFRTGDLGVVDGGEVFVTGRHKELLIVRGKNHTPPDLEATVTAATAGLGVREVAAFPVDQQGEEALGLAIELDGDDRVEVARRTRRAVSERHGLAVAAMFLVPAGTLPRTPTRKLARHACARLAAEGRWAAWAVEQTSLAVIPAPDASLAILRGPALREALRGRLVAMTGAPSAETPIADLGLSSLDVARAAAALRLATGVEPPFAPFFDGSTLVAFADTLADTMEGVAPTEAAVPGWRDLVATVVERMPTTRPPVREGAGAGRDGPVFLTGATGFLGAWILAELLRAGHEVRCLVRAVDVAAGEARLRKALASGPGMPAEGVLVAIPGDLTLPRFGLSDDQWNALGDVGVLVHNAADVNFVAPYPALRPSNVDPVLPILDLALAGAVARPVHFVSTTAVFNTRNRREQRRILGSDRVLEPEFLYSGYAQTKWVAETLLRVASAYAVPVAVHRPGVIVGASATGQAHRDDFLCRFLKGCVELGVYPEADIELDLVAVDHVAAGIAAQVGRPIQSTLDPYHWTTAAPTTLQALLATYAALGHPLRPEPLPRWLDRIRTDLPADNALFPVHPFLLERPGGAPLTLLELLDGLPLQVDPAGACPCPPVDPARMAGWLQSQGFLPTPARNRP